MKNLQAFAAICAGLAASAHAQLSLTINEYTTGTLSFTISGTVETDVIGDQKQWIAVKPRWSTNYGVNVPWVADSIGFTSLQNSAFTIIENSVLIGGSTPTQSNVAASGQTWGDSFYFAHSGNITAGTSVTGTLTVALNGAFDDSLPESDFELLTGFDNAAGDWSRNEANAGDPCDAADFNDDGSINTQDVLAFLNAWTAADSSADCNGDSSVNTQDVLCFLNVWNACR